MKSIFVGNLDFNVAEDDLRQLFGRYGQVDRITVMTDRETGRSRGFAFVDMANRDEAEKAIAELNSSELAGRSLNVTEARPKVERDGGRDRDRGGRRKSGGGRW
jgi:cold-inducible RNA-binding protein